MSTTGSPLSPATGIQRAAFNLLSVIGGESLLRLASFAAAVVIARNHGPVLLGIYATVLAYVSLLTMLADNGLQISAVTELSGRRDVLNATVSRLFLSKTLLFLLVLVAFLAILAALQPSRQVWLICMLVAPRLILQSYCQLELAIFKSLDRMTVIGVVQVAHFSFDMAGIGFAYYTHRSLEFLLIWLVLGQLLELLLSALVLWTTGLQVTAVGWSDCLRLVRHSTAKGFSLALANGIMRADMIILSALAVPVVVGQFAAAQMIIAMAYVVSWLFGSVVLPDLVRAAATKGGVDHHVSRWSRLVLLVAVPATIIAVPLTPTVVAILYGPTYSDTGRLAAIMVAAIPIILLNSLQFNRAIALQHKTVYLGTYAITVLIALALDLTLINLMGSMGLAIAIVMREVTMFAIFRLSAARVMRLAQA